MSRSPAMGRRAVLNSVSSAALLLATPEAGARAAELDGELIAHLDEARALMQASMSPPVTLPEVPNLPWIWSNAAEAIRELPVQGWRLSTACILSATNAEEAGDHVRAHNLLMAASAAVHQQMGGRDIKAAFNTEVYPDVAAVRRAGLEPCA
ncbi:hypothetical protein [Roseomonas chloroacetimidivorans]|uniref:hypothetical protein n=1 Tax=Roseomonas chloroacetimidivorans TaxID=1766656 RepID=UPI003C715763